MKTQRELDAYVALYVMGWTYISSWDGITGWRGRSPEGQVRAIPHYSTKISDVWPVFERLGKMGRCPTLHHGPTDADGEPTYSVHLTNPSTTDDPCTAPTAPHAICLAALQAVGAEAPA